MEHGMEQLVVLFAVEHGDQSSLTGMRSLTGPKCSSEE